MTAPAPSPGEGAGSNAATAELEAGAPGGDCVVRVGGDWRLNMPVPSWKEVSGQHAVSNVRVQPDHLGRWDTSLLLFLIGSFVLGGLLLVVVALLSIRSLHPFSKPGRFVAYFNESVQGLDVGSPVRLRGRSMVVRTGTNEVHFAEFERWAEPVEQGIGRVMKECLSSDPHVESVTLNPHGDDSLDYEVRIRILACEGIRVEGGTGSIRFAASWEIQGLGTHPSATRRGGFIADNVAWDGKTYARLAQGLGEVITRASAALGADLAMVAR